MTKARLIAIPIVVLGIGAIAFGVHLNRRRNPEVLLQMLRAGRGDQNELMMRLQLVRGDVITPMIEHVADSSAPEPFRIEIIRALWRQYQRTPEKRVEEMMHDLRKDESAGIRREAFQGFSTYAEPDQKLLLMDQLTDPDDEVRQMAFAIFVTDRGAPEHAHEGMWAELSDEQRESLIETAKQVAASEEDPYRSYLAKAIVGREIEHLCNAATQARETGRLDRAEELSRQAVDLDPGHPRSAIHIARHYLALGEREKAIEEAAKHKALISIPKLSSAPVIDGDPNDPVWQEGFFGTDFHISYIKWAPRRARSKSEFRIGHHGGKIYITILAYQEQLDKLRSRVKERDGGNILRDDNMLIFFDPGVTDQNGYQFVINVGNVQSDLYKRNEKHNYNFKTGTGVFRDRGYWAGEFEFDIEELDPKGISESSVWAMNVQRGNMGASAETSQWWPTFPYGYRYVTWPLAVFEMN